MNRDQVQKYFIRHGLKFQEKTMERAIDVVFELATDMANEIIEQKLAEVHADIKQKEINLDFERKQIAQKLEESISSTKNALAIIGGAK